MTEKIYATRLVNDTKNVLMVYEDADALVEIQPGQDFLVESRSPLTYYARWSEVRWKADGSVHFVARSNWTEPERGRWVIKCLNKDGAQVERRIIAGRSIILPRGIPVLIGLRLDDPLVRFKALSITKKRVMLKDPEHEGYIIHETITKDELEKRDASEIKALEKLLTEKSNVEG